VAVGWVKTHRKVQEWEWYKDSYCFHLFLHLILKANTKPKTWRGHEIMRGQLVTTIENLSKETGMSFQIVRARLEKLKKTKEITLQSTNKFTVLTIVNYHLYQQRKSRATNKQKEAHFSTNNQQTKQGEINKQNISKPTNKIVPEIFGIRAFESVEAEKSTNNQQTNEQTNNKQNYSTSTTTKEDKKKEVKSKNKPYIPLLADLPDWLPGQLFIDFVENRIEKKVPMTEKAVKLAIGKLHGFHKLGYDITAALEDAIINGWQSFYPKELKEKNYANSRANIGKSNNRNEGKASGKHGGFSSKTEQLRYFRENLNARSQKQPGSDERND